MLLDLNHEAMRTIPRDIERVVDRRQGSGRKKDVDNRTGN
jgi:hypothetical protein